MHFLFHYDWCVNIHFCFFLENELLKQLQRARDERLAAEKKREDLVKKARTMQAKTNNRRNQGALVSYFNF